MYWPEDFFLEADTTRRGPKGGGSSCPPEIKLQLLLPVEGGVCFLLLNVPSEASARWDDSAMGLPLCGGKIPQGQPGHHQRP